MVTTCGAVARFYWTRGAAEHMPRLPVQAAAATAARYSLGSIALGSVIIALIQFVRCAALSLVMQTSTPC